MLLRSNAILSQRQKVIVQIVTVSSAIELHNGSCKGQEHLEGKVEGTSSSICMEIYWTSLSKIKSEGKERAELCSMKET